MSRGLHPIKGKGHMELFDVLLVGALDALRLGASVLCVLYIHSLLPLPAASFKSTRVHGMLRLRLSPSMLTSAYCYSYYFSTMYCDIILLFYYVL